MGGSPTRPGGSVMDEYESARRKTRVSQQRGRAGRTKRLRTEGGGPRRLRLRLCPRPPGVGRDLCAKLLCACDQSAAGCMASAFYNRSLQAAGRGDCRGDRPTCEGGGPAASAPGSSSEEDSEEAPPLSGA